MHRISLLPLPYGRGGSPIQNMILRGNNFQKYVQSKFKKLRLRDIYLKQNISLKGKILMIFGQKINKKNFFYDKKDY